MDRKTELAKRGLFLALVALFAVGCKTSTRPMHIERGLEPQASVIPDRTSLSKPYLTYGQIGFTTPGQLEEHFDNHGAEFKAISPPQFLQFAQELRDRPKDPTFLECKRFDGVVCRFDPESGAFLAYNKDRTIRTFFKPKDGDAYFYRQMHRLH